MATVTITITDKPSDAEPDRINVKVLSEPGFEIGPDADPLTPAQSLAIRMIEAGGSGEVTSATGTRRDDGLAETVQFFADGGDPD